MFGNDLWLYRIRPTRLAMLTEGPTHEEGQAIEDHFTYLQALAKTGVVLLAGRTQTTGPDSFGIVIFRAESPEAAERLMHEDPAVARGVMDSALFPYRIALLSERIGEAV